MLYNVAGHCKLHSPTTNKTVHLDVRFSVTMVTVAFHLQCALETCYWTIFNHVVVWGSILFYFGFTFIFYSDFFSYSYVGTARNLMTTANFWFTLILTVTILLVPVVAERFYMMDTRPTLTDKVRFKMQRSSMKTRTGQIILRRHSTLRHSFRSVNRSGYAFSHTEGFGRLITTGTNMLTTIASGARPKPKLMTKKRMPNSPMQSDNYLSAHFSSDVLNGKYTTRPNDSKPVYS